MGNIKFAAGDDDVCLFVCLFGAQLLRNCWKDLAAIIHRDGSLSRKLRLAFAGYIPRVSKYQTPKRR